MTPADDGRWWGRIHPNPVHGSERVLITPGSEITWVQIFDPGGRLVRVLTTPETGPLSWDLRDRRGTRVPSGVYYLRGVGTGAGRPGSVGTGRVVVR